MGSILLSLSLWWRGFFPLELTWVLTPFPKTLSDESINRGLVCTHMMHSIAQTQKILTCPRQVNADNRNATSMHHPQRQNVTISMAELKNGHICKNLTKNGEPQRHSWERRRRRRNPQIVSGSWLARDCLTFV